MPLNNLTYFLIGGGVGLVGAIVGASVDYLIARRRTQDRRANGSPGCLLIVAGGLGFVGLIVIIASWLLSNSVTPAVAAGAGVMVGFFLGFAVLFVGSVIWSAGKR